MGQLSFDVGDAFKSLRRSPGYTATVMATLALTIGGTTAVFSIVNGVLLKPLAYREAHQLVAVREIWREDSPSPAGLPVNENHFEYWREHAHTFSAMAQYIARPANLTGAGDAVQVTTVRASGSLFDVLQIHAATGRLLTPDDERPDRPHVAVLSDAWWRQRYHGDSSVIGRILTLDDTTYAIVGILPQGFWWEFSARVHAAGLRAAEVPVRHRPRAAGTTQVYRPAKVPRIAVVHFLGLLALRRDITRSVRHP